MNTYTFQITPYDLAFLGAIFIGIFLALQLGFAGRSNRVANRLLALALCNIVLQLIWVLGVDVRLGVYFTHWHLLPLQYSLAIGPLIYFYVLKITRPAYKFLWTDLLHFIPLLLQQGVLILEINESIRPGVSTYDTLIFRQLNPVLQLLTAISVITYLYLSHWLIERFYQRLKFNYVSDRYRYEWRWLHHLLAGFGLLWLLWIPCTAVNYFYPSPIRAACLLSYVPAFSGNDNLDSGRGIFKTGSWRARPCVTGSKTVFPGVNEAKRHFAEESHGSQPVLQRCGTEFRLTG